MTFSSFWESSESLPPDVLPELELFPLLLSEDSPEQDPEDSEGADADPVELDEFSSLDVLLWLLSELLVLCC